MRPILPIALLFVSPAALTPQDRIIRIPKLENDKVKVTEVVYDPGAPRAHSTRQTDQIIVFVEDCKYQRIDSKTGGRAIQQRKSGDVIWHNKGEDAPVLINVGEKPYRTLVIELKK